MPKIYAQDGIPRVDPKQMGNIEQRRCHRREIEPEALMTSGRSSHTSANLERVGIV